jgi:hypothetical protein
MCVATTKDKIQDKLNDTGTVCVFVEYAVNNSDAVYRLLIQNKQIMLRDVI